MAFPDITPDLKAAMPDLRGRLLANQSLAELTWFRVGGPAQVLFTPADEDDLAYFLKHLPRELPDARRVVTPPRSGTTHSTSSARTSSTAPRSKFAARHRLTTSIALFPTTRAYASGLFESDPERRSAPGPEHVARLLEGDDDPADVLDRAPNEEVDARRLAARAADVGEEPDDALL